MKTLDIFTDIIKTRISNNPNILNKALALNKIKIDIEETNIFIYEEEIEEDDEFHQLELSAEDVPLDDRINKWRDYYKDKPPVFEDEFDSEINERTEEHGRTKFHKACGEGNLEEVKRLIEIGINHKIRDNNGRTGYILALLEDHSEVIKELEDQGVHE